MPLPKNNMMSDFIFDNINPSPKIHIFTHVGNFGDLRSILDT